MKNFFWLPLFLCELALLAACGGGGSAGPSFGTATHFSVSAPANATAGTQFQFTVTTLDASNNIVASYSGTVHFTSTDGQAALPADSTLTNGAKQFQATLNTDGSKTIIATDTVTASIHGSSDSINVSAGSAANPVPLINEPLSPDAIIPGGPDFNLTVNGTGFVPGSSVKWNVAGRVTTFVSNSRLTAVIHAADIANFNTASVTVVNPAPGGGTSNVAFFETTRPTSAVALSLASQFNAGPLPHSLATGDFNGDGNLDLALSDFSGNVSILLGKGDGTFQSAVNYSAGSAPFSIAVGDFNGDGKLDLAVLNNGGGNISILLGNGDGTFQPAVNNGVGTDPRSVAVGDFNGDGKLDLAVANTGSGNVSVLLGNGNGSFQVASECNAHSQPISVGVGDFNGDGKLDLAVGNAGSGDVSILLGNGDGTFKPAVNYQLGSGSNPISVAVGDLNGDGKLDLVFADPQNASVFVLIGNGDGTFKAAKSVGVESTPVWVAIGDINGDGKPDVAVAYDAGQDVSVLLGNGDGTFQPALNYGAGFGASSLSLGDFNGDGRMDIAGANFGGSTLSLLLQPGLVSGPGVVLSSTSVAFPTQLIGRTSSAETVTLTNNGSEALSITNISVSSSFAETNTCDSTLAAGGSCSINVTFTPGAINLVTGSLTITDNAPGSPQAVSLNGQGTVVQLVPSAMNFSCTVLHGCGLPQNATLTNTGNTTLHITSITASGPFSQTNNCPASLAARGSCTIAVTYLGNETRLSHVNVSDDGGGSPQEITLRGAVQ